jgi:hypothetical protein
MPTATKVRMLVTLTGTRNGVDWPPVGGEIELPAAEAADLVAAGHAESADKPARKRRGKKVPRATILDEPASLAEADLWKEVRDG